MTTSDALLMGLLLDTPPINPSGGGGGGSRYTVESLTFSGGLITDAVREAGVEGDGLPIPGGVGPWPAATNLVTQSVPGADATTGVTKAGDAGATLTLVTDATAPFQASQTEVWLLDNSAGATDATVDFAGNATAAAHTGSIWAKAISGSPTVSIGGGGTPTTITGTDSYARYSQSRTASAGDNLRSTAPAGAVVRFTAAQLETGSIATPFVVTDGSTESRTAGRVQMPVADLFTATQGAVFARLKLPWTSEPVTDPGIFTWADNVSNRLEMHLDTSTGQQVSIVRAASGSTDNTSQAYAWGDNTGFGAAFAWTASAVKVSANGAAFFSKSSSNIPTLSATTAELGGRTGVGSGREINGNILWLATFAGTLTDDDAAALDAFGDTPPTWAQLVGALPATAQVTGLWTCVNDQFFKAT